MQTALRADRDQQALCPYRDQQVKAVPLPEVEEQAAASQVMASLAASSAAEVPLPEEAALPQAVATTSNRVHRVHRVHRHILA